MEIQIFKDDRFGEIRTMTIPDGQVGFVGKDVAEVLGYSNTRDAIRKHVDDEDKTTVAICDTGSNYKTQATIINESGLYSLILSSKLPQAREFKHWVTSEVLPQIRRTGGYVPVKAEDTPEELMARALIVAQKTIEQKDVLLAQRDAMLLAQRPKVLFAEALAASPDSILISEMAKLLTQNGYEIGRTRFFTWLREKGYLFKQSTEPIQKWVERGIFETEVTLITTDKGQKERLTTKITGKGQEYFIQLLCKARE